MDYRASWEAWARKNYDDPAVVSAASAAAVAASAAGAAQWDAAIAAHRAAIRAGGEYVCRPDRAGLAIGLCVVLFLLLVPAALAGLTVNPGLAGYVFLAGSIALPVLAVVGIVQVRRHSCFFVDRFHVGRRDWRGKTAVSVAREAITSVRVDTPALEDALLSNEADETSVEIRGRGGEPLIPMTDTYWWSAARTREFAAVAKP